MKANPITEDDVQEAMWGKTVVVPLPDGGGIRLMMRRKMLYLTYLTNRDMITGQRRTPAGEASKGPARSLEVATRGESPLPLLPGAGGV